MGSRRVAVALVKIIALVAHEVVAECRKVGQSPVNGSGASEHV
jgi:hypothetical protein